MFKIYLQCFHLCFRLRKLNNIRYVRSSRRKSLYVANLINNNATILANDMNEIRRKRLEYNIEKQEASSIIVWVQMEEPLAKD